MKITWLCYEHDENFDLGYDSTKANKLLIYV